MVAPYNDGNIEEMVVLSPDPLLSTLVFELPVPRDSPEGMYSLYIFHDAKRDKEASSSGPDLLGMTFSFVTKHGDEQVLAFVPCQRINQILDDAAHGRPLDNHDGNAAIPWSLWAENHCIWLPACRARKCSIYGWRFVALIRSDPNTLSIFYPDHAFSLSRSSPPLEYLAIFDFNPVRQRYLAAQNPSSSSSSETVLDHGSDLVVQNTLSWRADDYFEIPETAAASSCNVVMSTKEVPYAGVVMLQDTLVVVSHSVSVCYRSLTALHPRLWLRDGIPYNQLSTSSVSE